MSLDIYTEMVEAGNAEIAQLDSQIQDIDGRIAALEQEQDALKLAATERSAAIVQARLAVVKAEGTYNEATGYAKLASDKPNEQQAIKAVSATRKAHEAARKELACLEKEDNELSQMVEARETEISKQLYLLRSEKETCQAQVRSVQMGRDKAHTELGEQLIAQLMESYQSEQKHIDELSSQVVLAKAGQHLLYMQGVVQLADWPALRTAFARLQQSDDATIRVLEASLHYIKTVLADLPYANDTPLLPSLKGTSPTFGGYYPLRPELLIHHGDVLAVLQRFPQALVARRDRLNQLLEEYRAYLQGV